MNLYIQEIIQPLDHLGPESPTVQSPLHSPPESPPRTHHRIMTASNQSTWRAITSLNLDAPLHYFPEHLERMLPKFDPGKGIYAEDQSKIFFFALELLSVEHEDVVCRLFPHTFEPKTSSWFFSLQPNSIKNWDTFERVFKSKFGSKKTLTTLMKELFSLRMEKKENVQDFNQRFTNHLINFSDTTNPAEELLVEYYTTTLSPQLAMFVKRAVKLTLVENFEEANKVEDDLDSITKHTSEPEVNTISGKKPLLLTRPKEEHSNELENVVKMVQKLSNKIVDLEKDKEASSSKKQFKPYFKKKGREWTVSTSSV